MPQFGERGGGWVVLQFVLMGHEGADSALLDGALDLAERLAAAAEEGRVDLGDLGRRARKLLAATAKPAETEPLF